MCSVPWTEITEVLWEMSLAHGLELLASRYFDNPSSSLATNRRVFPQQTTQAYTKVVELFKQNLGKSRPSGSGGMQVDDNGSVTAMTQDLLLLLLPSLSATDAQTLFDLCISAQVLEDRNTGVQKRGYKILGKLIENGTVTVDPETVIKQLDGVSDGLTAAAKKVGVVSHLNLRQSHSRFRIDFISLHFLSLLYPPQLCT